MTGREIVERAVDMGNRCVYWYGAKRQIPTKELAKKLRLNNPSVWTDEYYEAALKDIGSGKRVCDCSGLVCYAYDIPDIGTSQFAKKFEEINPKNLGTEYIPGSIAWRSGHCGIITDKIGHVAEMRGLKWDFCKDRTFTEAKFTKCYVLTSVKYDFGDPTHAPGWHKDSLGWWYATGWSAGEYYKSGFYEIDNSWYFFNADGYIQTGIFKADGNLYAADDNGILFSRNICRKITTVEEVKMYCSLGRARRHD